MTVYKRPNSPYFHYDFVWKGRRYSGSTGLPTKRAAQEFENQVRHKAVLALAEKPPITVDEAAGVYSDHAQTLSSWPTARYILTAMVAGLGKARLLSELSTLALQDHFARRRNGRANASVNREIEVARAMWRRVADLGYDIGEMPKWHRLFLKVSEQPPRELTIADEPALFEELRADVIDVCDFALKSGWRLSEVIGLRWSDCDLAAQQAVTRIKGGDVVRRPLTPTLIAIIANQPKAGPFVFTYQAQKTRGAFVDKRGRKHPARVKGERYPMSKTALRRPWAAAKKAAELEDLRFHDLRHTRGTRIVRNTGSLAAAKEALKHRSLRTTLRYAHVLDDDVRAALEASESRTIPAEKAPKTKKA